MGQGERRVEEKKQEETERQRKWRKKKKYWGYYKYNLGKYLLIKTIFHSLQRGLLTRLN